MVSMTNVLTICGVLATSIIGVYGFGTEKMLGKGTWSILNVQTCENNDQYQYQITAQQHKMNRTHVGFTGKLDTGGDIDETCAIRVELCKWLDGGCKPFQVMADKCFCCFAKEHGGENYYRVLKTIGVDSADCPIPKGHYEWENYVFDFKELPEDGVYGKFDGKAFLIKDGVDLACIKMTVEFV